MAKVFDGPAEALRSFHFVVSRPWALLRLAGPFVLIMTVVTMWSLHQLRVTKKGDVSSLMFVLICLFAMSLTLPLFMLLWHRFVLSSQVGGRATPLRIMDYWGFLWRWWLFSILVGTITKAVTASHATNSELIHTCLHVVSFVIVLAGIGARHTLALPSIAIMHSPLAMPERTLLLRRLGPGFVRGMLTVGVFYSMIDLLPSPNLLIMPDVTLATLCVISSILSFGALAVFSTYVCRSYMAAQLDLT